MPQERLFKYALLAKAKHTKSFGWNHFGLDS